MRRFSCCWALVGLASVWAGSSFGEPTNTGTLLEEMIDLVRLADFPEPGYRTVQFSSHDHRSVLPGGPDWFANSDGFGGEPIPNFEAVLDEPDAEGTGRYLICDVEGPGAIVRTWTAAIRGTVRVFFDGKPQPAFDGPAQQFLQESYRPYADAIGLDSDLLAAAFRQRDACYLPMPFAERCRIEWIGNLKQIHFYEVQIRRYDPEAEVVTFSAQDLKTFAPLVERVASVLSEPGAHWPYRAESDASRAIEATVQPQQTVEALSLEGPAAIERLTLRLSAPDLDRALRQTILHLVFDDYPWGQVQCPVGDFFGAAPGINPYDSVPFTVERDGTMTCRYVMPFARSCRILLENRSSEPVAVTGNVLPMPYSWDAERSLHFRARWRVDHDLVARGGDGAQDLPFLIAGGKGVYVGTAVMLMNPNPIPTSYGNWWGEGDEKVFVDEDVCPSTFGTGSEDYFNYSWSSPDIFLYAYCGQPRNDGPANRGFVVNHRWHILDALPFGQRIAFSMELFSHERTPGVSYARIAYHYGRPGLIDDHVVITDEDVRPPRLPPDWQPAARMGARGSTFFQAEEVLADDEATSLETGGLWAGGKLLQWSPKNAEAELTFDLPVAESGKYALHVTAAQTPRSGRLAATLDGQPLPFATEDGTVDLKTDFRVQSRTFSAPPRELKAGEHRLSLRRPGPASPEGQEVIGIDFLWLQRR